MTDFESAVGVAIALLGAALLVSVVAERAHVPYVVALLVVAAPIDLPHVPAHFAPTLVFVFLPALVFEAAWNIDAAMLRGRWFLVTLLAVPGVVLTALLVAAGLTLTRQLPFAPALLLGAILSATDPIAVIAVFRRLHVPPELATIVEGESLFNDGAAIVLHGVVLAMLSGAHTTPTALGIVWSALSVSVGGAAIGFVVAAIVARLLRGTAQAPLQVVGTIVAAFGSYLLAGRLHVSGIFAAVVVGIAMRAFPRFPSREAVADVDRFWSVMAFLANTLVFVMMGLRIEFARIVHEPLLVLLTLALVTLSRVALAFGAFALAGRRVARGWRSVVALSGMRGALSVALVVGLPADVPFRALLVDAVFGAVFVTVVLQGLTLGPLIAHLKLSEQAA